MGEWRAAWRESAMAGGVGWGRVAVILDESSGHHWFARENYHKGAFVPFEPAVSVDAAVKIGAASWRDCPGCNRNELHRSDDYLCIICREDPWLDEETWRFADPEREIPF